MFWHHQPITLIVKLKNLYQYHERLLLLAFDYHTASNS